MRLGTWLAAAVLVGCSSSLSYYGNQGGDGKDDGPATDATTTDAPLIDTATETPTDPTDSSDQTETDADADTDADSDADADADADADTDADADVDTGTALPTGAPIDGVYEGSIHIDYEFKLPFVGFTSNCDGPVSLVVDSTGYTPITGTIQCNWPILDIVAQLALGSSTTGNVTGAISGVLVAGSTDGSSDSGQLSWNETWTGTGYTTSFTGAFSGGTILYDEYDGTFEVTWVGP